MTLREGINQVTSGSRNVLIVCASVMFCVIVATAFGIERITNDPNVGIGVITILFAFYGTTLASLAALVKGEAIKQNTQHTLDNTEKLLNGELEKKIAKVVTNVLSTWLADESSRPRNRT